jgi:hypothetical protein
MQNNTKAFVFNFQRRNVDLFKLRMEKLSSERSIDIYNENSFESFGFVSMN